MMVRIEAVSFSAWSESSLNSVESSAIFSLKTPSFNVSIFTPTYRPGLSDHPCFSISSFDAILHNPSTSMYVPSGKCSLNIVSDSELRILVCFLLLFGKCLRGILFGQGPVTMRSINGVVNFSGINK